MKFLKAIGEDFGNIKKAALGGMAKAIIKAANPDVKIEEEKNEGQRLAEYKKAVDKRDRLIERQVKLQSEIEAIEGELKVIQSVIEENRFVIGELVSIKA